MKITPMSYSRIIASVCRNSFLVFLLIGSSVEIRNTRRAKAKTEEGAYESKLAGSRYENERQTFAGCSSIKSEESNLD